MQRRLEAKSLKEKWMKIRTKKAQTYHYLEEAKVELIGTQAMMEQKEEHMRRFVMTV